MHAEKNFLNSFFVANFVFFVNLIINKFTTLVNIESGNKKKNISIIEYPFINKKGVPRTKTPMPTADCNATIRHKYRMVK